MRGNNAVYIVGVELSWSPYQRHPRPAVHILLVETSSQCRCCIIPRRWWVVSMLGYHNIRSRSLQTRKLGHNIYKQSQSI